MDYKDFTESERKFYLQEAGFNSREEKLFRLRVYGEKTLWEASELMGYSPRTIDRINNRIKKKITKVAPMYTKCCHGLSEGKSSPSRSHHRTGTTDRAEQDRRCFTERGNWFAKGRFNTVRGSNKLCESHRYAWLDFWF